MKLEREHSIPAAQAAVWTALNDIEVLKGSIPGCENVDRLEDGSLRARVKIKVGPVSATFNGLLTFSDVDAPHGYRINFEGQGGAAGFARGHAIVRLRGEGADATVLTYEANAQVGGRLAQIGSRLIEGVAARTSAAFFESFSAIVGRQDPKQAQGIGTLAAGEVPPTSHPSAPTPR